jgi:hypothetical protein
MTQAPTLDSGVTPGIVLRIGGTLTLNSEDDEHTAFADTLTLGRFVRLEVLAEVTGTAQQIKGGSDDEEPIVTRLVTLKAASIDPLPVTHDVRPPT